jgi:hypothetical protein
LRLAFGVWRLAFASKRCRAWNNKSTRWQTDKKKVGKGHHSFSMRSLERNTMI